MWPTDGGAERRRWIVAGMRNRLIEFVRRNRVATRAEVLLHFPLHVLDDALADGVLVRLMPSVYAVAGAGGDRDLLRRGALSRWNNGALSHLDGLDVWRLPSSSSDLVHLTVPGDEAATQWAAVQLHRRRNWSPRDARVRDGLRVVPLEQAVIESWPLLPVVDRRVPAIVAVRERRTTSGRLLARLDTQPRTAGAKELRHVFTLAGSGCHSELELWGHEQVFADPRLPPSRCQVPVKMPSGSIYLDRLFEDVLVNAELDGAAYHGSSGQRERDIRRDAALAALGYLVVRFSHLRLHADPAGVIAELVTIIATRRRQLSLVTA